MKVIIIGIDGGTFDLILPWVKEGQLPNFRRLIERGSWGNLNSGPIPHSAIAWPSFFTGKNLGKHGIYDFYTMDFNTRANRLKHFNSADCDQEFFWERISSCGKKVSVINVPMTYPPSQVNGIFVSGFPMPYRCQDYVYPSEFKEKLDRICNGYQVLPQTVSAETDLLKFFEGAKEVVHRQFPALQHLLAKGEWDCLVYVFREVDAIEHFCWQYIDESHPELKKDEKLNKLILDYYKFVDNYLGYILEAIDEEVTLIIMSDHGMGPQINSFNLNNWLLKEGYLKLKGGLRGYLRKASMKLNICEADLFNFFLKKGPIGKIRELFTKKEVETKRRCFYKFKDIDWSKTKAYTFAINQLAINLKGREPEGIVEGGWECEDLIAELIEKLGKIKNPLSNTKLCTKIYRKSEIFHGEKLSYIPDIIIECNNHTCSAPGGYKIGSPKIFDKHPQKGNHTSEGIFLIYGKGVKSGCKLEGVNIVDVAATTLSLLDIGIPNDYDGKIVKSAFKSPDSYTENYIEPVYKGRKKEQVKEYKPEEIAEIEENLKSLGYL